MNIPPITGAPDEDLTQAEQDELDAAVRAAFKARLRPGPDRRAEAVIACWEAILRGLSPATDVHAIRVAMVRGAVPTVTIELTPSAETLEGLASAFRKYRLVDAWHGPEEPGSVSELLAGRQAKVRHGATGELWYVRRREAGVITLVSVDDENKQREVRSDDEFWRDFRVAGLEPITIPDEEDR